MCHDSSARRRKHVGPETKRHDHRDGATGDVVFNPEFHMMKHIAYFVRPHFLPLRGNQAGLTLAFQTRDSRHVLALANPSHKPAPVDLDRPFVRTHLILQPGSLIT